MLEIRDKAKGWVAKDTSSTVERLFCQRTEKSDGNSSYKPRLSHLDFRVEAIDISRRVGFWPLNLIIIMGLGFL